MIKLFRKIRQRLLSENKFSKYLLYAIGEIVLVVIGILIALQINNWNEDRKLKKLEKSYYKSLYLDLQKDSLEYVRKKNNASYNIRKLNNVTRFIDADYKYENTHIDSIRFSKITYKDTLALIFSCSQAGFVQLPQTYENTIMDLRSTGNIKLLSNENLKNNILDYYNIQKLYHSWNETLIGARESMEQELNHVLNKNARVAYNLKEGLKKDDMDFNSFVENLKNSKNFKSLAIGMLHLHYRIIKECDDALVRSIIPLMEELEKEF